MLLIFNILVVFCLLIALVMLIGIIFLIIRDECFNENSPCNIARRNGEKLYTEMLFILKQKI